jgi:hypothetical protein
MDEEFAFSYGVGLKGRYYFDPAMSGFNLGVAAELLRTRIEGERLRVATMTTLLVPQAEGGYRVAFDSFFLGASAALGYAFQLASGTENLPGGTLAESTDVEDVSTVYGSVALDVGVWF